MDRSTGSQDFQGLRTVIYAAADLEKAKAWYASTLGIAPYFDQPFYVGFNVGGYELGLDPDSAGTAGGGAVVYWGVADANAALEPLVSLGALARTSVQEVGEGIKVATVLDPFGNIFGSLRTRISNSNEYRGRTSEV